MPAVNEYKDGVVARLHKGLQGLVKSRKITYVEGLGRLVSPTAVEVDGQRYEGRHVVLATGSVPKSLPGLEIDGRLVLTSDHALALDSVPASVVVLGGGVIGCRVRQRVALLRRRRDHRRGAAAPGAAGGRAGVQGCSSAPSASARSVSSWAPASPASRRPTPASRSPSRTARRSRPTCCSSPSAAGRSRQDSATSRPASRWSAASSRSTSTARPASPRSPPSATSIPTLQLAHVGFGEGIMVAERLAGLDPAPIDYDGVPRVTYSEPEVASVGHHRGTGEGDVRRRRGRDRDLRPRRQRQEPDPQDRRLRQAGRDRRTARSSASTWSAAGSAS